MWISLLGGIGEDTVEIWDDEDKEGYPFNRTKESEQYISCNIMKNFIFYTKFELVLFWYMLQMYWKFDSPPWL